MVTKTSGKSVRVVTSCPASDNPVTLLGLLDLEDKKTRSVVKQGNTQPQAQRHIPEDLGLHFLTCSFIRKSMFRRFRKIANSDYWLRHVCPSVRPHIIIRLSLDGFYEI